MNSFTLLYLFYCAKIGCQAAIYFIWLSDSTSWSIAFLAAVVALFAIPPFFHVIVHVFSAKPLSSPTFIAYLCSSLLLAILWYKPTQDGKNCVLPFGLVTTFDLLAFLVFLLQRQIYHWRGIPTSDVEQGHLKVANIDNASMRLVARDNGQVERRDPAATLETRRLQVVRGLGYDIDAINRSGSNHRSVVGRSGWPTDGGGLDERLDDGGAGGSVREEVGGANERFAGAGVTGLLQGGVEGQGEMEEGQQESVSASIFCAGSEFKNIHSPPAIIASSDIHPALRAPFNDTYQPEPHDSFRATMLERNQF